MTMDIAQQEREDMKMLSPRITCDMQTVNKTNSVPQTKQPSVKRSFDVAFLMLPDEKLKNKQLQQQLQQQQQQQQQQHHHHHHHHQHPEKHPRLSADATVTYPPHINVRSDESLRKICEKRNDLLNGNSMKNGASNFLHVHNNNNETIKTNGRFLHQDLQFLTTQDLSSNDRDAPKSAFTKVPHVRQQESPIPSISPEQLSCPSTSPPISSSPPQNPLYQQFRNDYQLMNGSPFHTTISQMQQLAQNEKLRQQFAYRPTSHQSHNGEMSNANAYLSGTFPFSNGNSHPFVSQPDISGIVRNPAAAAALLTTLIPPTIATSFSLTAQNVCAKCNISFRMTSDLVYHMRSHHKSEFAADTNRRKREEKLKCPVCNESFRERHHLTRHMTAHQDKESDETENVQASRRQK